MPFTLVFYLALSMTLRLYTKVITDMVKEDHPPQKYRRLRLSKCAANV